MNCIRIEKFSRWSLGRLNAGAEVGIMLAFNFPRCERFLWPGWGDLSDSEIVEIAVPDVYGYRWTCGLFNYLRYETLLPCNFLRSQLAMNLPSPHTSLWNAYACYHVYKIARQDCVLSQLNPVRACNILPNFVVLSHVAWEMRPSAGQTDMTYRLCFF
jgi:hypothetical protein